MTKILPYKEGHLDFLVPLDVYDKDAKETIERHCHNPKHAVYTLVKGFQIVGVVGCCETEKHVLSIWAIVDKSVERFPIFYHKSLRNLIDGHVDALGIRRVQSVVASSNDRAIAQHLKLGFEIEAHMLKSGPRGEDQFLFRRLT